MTASTGGHLRLFGPGRGRLVGAAHRYQARPGCLGDPPGRRRQPVDGFERHLALAAVGVTSADGLHPGAAAPIMPALPQAVAAP